MAFIHPDLSIPFVAKVDTSEVGVGVVLPQTERPEFAGPLCGILIKKSTIYQPHNKHAPKVEKNCHTLSKLATSIFNRLVFLNFFFYITVTDMHVKDIKHLYSMSPKALPYTSLHIILIKKTYSSI